ncbi:MAG TPA: carboxymuconolactone decarboxylase family protein [Acidisphaera sp.]|nr:carboxymuconolactone decarboxylase family protein [Acidisphaera sp.]
MSRIAIPTRDEAPAASQPLLDATAKQLGTIPNLHRVIGLSPKALEAYVGFEHALGRTLDVKTRERIALATAQVNGCDYCLSAHTFLGANFTKLDAAEMAQNRLGHSNDARADAALVFARKVVEARGQVSDADLDTVRRAGFTDAQVIEIVANVALNVLTNFVNNVAETDIDFPVVRAAA